MKSRKFVKYLMLSVSTLILIGVLLFLVIPKVSAATGCFPDTNGHWAETFICWLKNNGITGGYPDGTYRPENSVTRAEMSVFVKNVYDVAEANDDDTLAGLGCANWQTAKWNGSNWECRNDNDVLRSLSCSNNQVAKWNGSAWVCKNDTDTDTDTLAGLSCATNQIAKWNGSAWVCAADVDTTGNTGLIYINVGHQNWHPFKSTDNITLEYYSNEMWFRKATTGSNWLSVAPSLPSSMYGKRLYLNGVRLCYDTESDTTLSGVTIYRQYGSDSWVQLLSDTTDRTDSACRTYTLSSPHLLSYNDGIHLWLTVDWGVANTPFGVGITTFILEPSNVNAAIPEGTVFKPGASGGEAASPDQ